MAAKVNFKQFLILEVSREECISWGGMSVCDFCNMPFDKSYYVAVLNQCLCPKCFEEFKSTAKWYPEDAHIEKRNFDYYSERLRMNEMAESLMAKGYM